MVLPGQRVGTFETLDEVYHPGPPGTASPERQDLVLSLDCLFWMREGTVFAFGYLHTRMVSCFNERSFGS